MQCFQTLKRANLDQICIYFFRRSIKRSKNSFIRPLHFVHNYYRGYRITQTVADARFSFPFSVIFPAPTCSPLNLLPHTTATYSITESSIVANITCVHGPPILTTMICRDDRCLRGLEWYWRVEVDWRWWFYWWYRHMGIKFEP